LVLGKRKPITAASAIKAGRVQTMSPPGVNAPGILLAVLGQIQPSVSTSSLTQTGRALMM
jgi:hypothetical protein